MREREIQGTEWVAEPGEEREPVQRAPGRGCDPWLKEATNGQSWGNSHSGCPCDRWPKSNGKTQFKMIIHAANIAQLCRVESGLGTRRMDLDGESEKKCSTTMF